MAHNPDPDPWDTPGLEPGGGVPPGETPPGESSMSGAGPEEIPHNPAKGWAAGPTLLIVVLSLLFVVFFVAFAVALW